MTFEKAATLGLGVTTAALGLYQILYLALPTSPAQGENKKSVLIS